MATPTNDTYTTAGTTVIAGLPSGGGADTTAPVWGGATLLVSNLTQTSYTLTASAPASDNLAVTGYEYSVTGGASWINNGASLTAAVGGRTAGTTDACRFRAFDAAGNRSAALSASAVLPAGSVWASVSALLQAIDEDSWVKVSANTFASAWPSLDAEPLMTSGNVASPGAIIVAWSSMALDDANGRIILWGGGHANTSCNAPFLWHAATRQWSMAFAPTDNVFMPNAVSLYTAQPGLWRNVESWQYSPASSHTYGNNAWLPKINRFLTWGGAAWNTGHALHVFDPATGNGIRPRAGYTLDLTLAGQGFVGGGTGSNVKRNSTAGVTLTGALAWKPRDYLLDHANPTVANVMRGHLEGFAVYREENGHDVLYTRASTQVGGSCDTLVRVEFIDDDYHNDLLSIVGRAGSSLHSDQGGAIDPVAGVVLACGYSAQPIEAWRLATAGPTNDPFCVAAANVGGAGKASYLAAMDAHFAVRPQSSGMGITFDTQRGRFVMWGGLRALWTTSTPANLSTGWTIGQLPTTGPDAPVYGTETGVHGKFKYSAAMDCYLGLVNGNNGEVWAYKPANWNPKV